MRRNLGTLFKRGNLAPAENSFESSTKSERYIFLENIRERVGGRRGAFNREAIKVKDRGWISSGDNKIRMNRLEGSGQSEGGGSIGVRALESELSFSQVGRDGVR